MAILKDTPEQTVRRSDSTLRRRVCGLCDMPLYAAKRGLCGAIYEPESCFWVKKFAEARATEGGAT